jgi:hypothetical protein
MDSLLLKPGTITNWAVTNIAGLAALSILLIGSSIVTGMILNDAHHAIFFPLYWRTKTYKSLVQRERPKIEMIRLIVYDSFNKYGLSHISDETKKGEFGKLSGDLQIGDLQWWFILPLSGGNIFSLFLEEYYDPFQFFGSMVLALIVFAYAIFWYLLIVVNVQPVQVGSIRLRTEWAISILIVALALFCLRRAYRWFLDCYSTQINLIFGVLVDLAFRGVIEMRNQNKTVPRPGKSDGNTDVGVDKSDKVANEK